MTTVATDHRTKEYLQKLGVHKPTHAVVHGNQWQIGNGPEIVVRSPIDGGELVRMPTAAAVDVDRSVVAAAEAFQSWRMVPSPVRGQLVREIGERLRQQKKDLAQLVTLECGKILQESLGEVQEMIDICEFAVGLSRQLYGLTMASERPGHRLTEQWHPLGPVGVISAFNFPVAVWSWNAMLALVCGDPVIWKPSEKTPLTAMACHAIAMECVAEMDEAPSDLLQLVVGGADVGQALAAHPGIPLVSATGSVPMGRSVAQTVAGRLGRSLLELGGNNAAVVAESADLDLAIRAIVFSAAGTCGQRCTSLRRLIVHETVGDEVRRRVLAAYETLPIGDPRDEGVLVGPLIDEAAYEHMQSALDQARDQGGNVHGGHRINDSVPTGGFYVQPALVEIDLSAPIVQNETFAPILYFGTYRDFADAIAIQNGVPQGLSSAVFTRDMREAEWFCSPAGSDCGLANVNIGTSGAEIGGAFGGEKETGGGRESGSDAWRAYMRRATNTINYSRDLPLAQGIKFDI